MKKLFDDICELVEIVYLLAITLALTAGALFITLAAFSAHWALGLVALVVSYFFVKASALSMITPDRGN